MIILLCLATYVSVLILLIMATVCRLKRPAFLSNSENRFSIHITETYAMIGGLCSIAGTIMLIAFSIDAREKEPLFFYAMCCSFVWFGAYITIKSLAFRIDVKGEQIIIYSMIHKPRILYPGDLISVKRQTKQARTHQMERVVIKTNKTGRIIVENSFFNYERFIVFLRKHGVAIVDK